MVKIAIIYKDIEFVRNLEETLHNRIKETIDIDLSVELLLEEFHEKYVFPRDCDEFLLLCSVDTDVDFSKIPEGCIIIPISQKGKNVESTGSNLQKINAFEYDDKNHSVSVDTLCDIILDKLGIIKNSRKIFISYKRSETKRLAEMVRKALSDAGYTVFLDTRDIDVGSDFMQEIRQSIVESDIFLMLNSESYYDSLYTKKELYAACVSGTAIVVLSSKGNNNKNLNGLEYVEIDDYNKESGGYGTLLLFDKDRINIIKKIQDVRLRLWKSRHQRLNRRMSLFQEKESFLQGVHIPCKSMREHSIIYAITGLPNTLDFQRIQQHGSRFAEETGNNKVYALYDDLSLPVSYSKHLNWLKAEMRNINLIKTSSFESDTSRMIKHIKKMNNRKPIVFLSASIPNEDDNDYNFLKIHDIIVTLTEAVIKSGGTLVFGGHPTITPIILNIMEIMSENNNKGVKTYPNIYLYQSEFFKTKFPPETWAFPEERRKVIPMVPCSDYSVGETEKDAIEKDLSLASMREAMINDYSYTSAIFIGGRYNKEKCVESSGVWDEYLKFSSKHPKAKCLYIENTGIVPLKLYEYYSEDKFEKIMVEDLPSKL